MERLVVLLKRLSPVRLGMVRVLARQMGLNPDHAERLARSLAWRGEITFEPATPPARRNP